MGIHRIKMKNLLVVMLVVILLFGGLSNVQAEGSYSYNTTTHWTGNFIPESLWKIGDNLETKNKYTTYDVELTAGDIKRAENGELKAYASACMWQGITNWHYGSLTLVFYNAEGQAYYGNTKTWGDAPNTSDDNTMLNSKNATYYGVSLWGKGSEGESCTRQYEYFLCLGSSENKSGYSDTTPWNKNAGSRTDSAFTNGLTVPAGTVRIRYVLCMRGSLYYPAAKNLCLRLYDTTAPTLNSISAVTDDGRALAAEHPAGTKVTYTFTFSETGSFSGGGGVSFNYGNEIVWGGSTTENGVTSCKYIYTIPSSGTISDDLVVGLKAINNLTLTDDAGNATTINWDEARINNFNSSVGTSGVIRMDNRPPELVSITSEGFSMNSVLKVGDTIKLNLNFHENISVTGTPTIALSNGNTMNYVNGSSTDTNVASFTYTIADGEDGNYLKISGFDLGGIRDGVNQDTTASTKYNIFTNAANTKGYLDSYGLLIDTTAPNIFLPEFTEGNILGSNAVVKASVTDNILERITGCGVKLVQYAWIPNSSEPTNSDYTDVVHKEDEPFTIPLPTQSGNYILWMKAKDNVGNTATTHSNIAATFDLSAPEITINTLILENGKIYGVNLDVNDAEDHLDDISYVWYRQKDEVQILKGTLKKGYKENEFLYPSEEGTYKIVVNAKDTAGNQAEEKMMGRIIIDRTAPDIQFSCGTSGYRKSHQITAKVEDTLTDVKKVEYQWCQESDTAKLSQDAWQDADQERTFASPAGEDGEWHLYIRATDYAGNSKIKSATCLLDNSAPTVMITPNGNENNVGYNHYTVQAVVSDTVTAESDLQVSYAITTSNVFPEASVFTNVEDKTNIQLNIENMVDDTWIHILAVDSCGNKKMFTSKPFIMDKNAPTGTISIGSDWAAITNKVNGSVSLTVSDHYSQNDDIKMCFTINNEVGQWEPFASTKSMTIPKTEGEHRISVRFKDLAGNESESYEVKVTYDCTPPEIDLSYSTIEATNQDVTVTASTALSDDEIQGVATYTFTENGEHTFVAKDQAGNIASKTAKVTWIDKTAPTIEILCEEADGKAHKNATVTLQGSDSQNEVKNCYYRYYDKNNGLEIQENNDNETMGSWNTISNGERFSLPKDLDGTYIVEAYSVDAVGNQSKTESITIKLDNTVPKAEITYSPAGRTAQNVTAHISFSDASPVKVTNPLDGSADYEFTDNGEFTFTFEDEAGNEGTAQAKVDWIDRSVPTMEVSVTDSTTGETVPDATWTSSDLIVKLNRTRNTQQIKSLTFNGININGENISEVSGIEPVANEGDTYLVSEYGVLHYELLDEETGITGEGDLHLYIDKQAPECEDEDVYISKIEWTNQNVTVRVTPVDDLSEVITYLERQVNVVEGQEVETWLENERANTWVYKENGSHTFYFRDQAGNIGSKTVDITNIDKEAPIATLNYHIKKDGKDHDYNPSNWTNQNVTVSVKFESISPVAITNHDGLDEYTFEQNGSTEFTYQDAAGNTGSITANVDKIDKIAPTGTFTQNITGWTNQNVTVTLHASDEASGAEDISYVYTENGTYEFELKDRAGNQTTYTYAVDRIDKEAPKITVTYSPNNSRNTPFAVYAMATADERVTWLGDRTSLRFDENGESYFRAWDRAGNMTEEKVCVNWITEGLPAVELVYSKRKPTNQNVEVELKTVDANDVILVQNNGQSRKYTFEENGTFEFHYTDVASKSEGTIEAKVNWIDKTGPKLSVEYDRKELGSEGVTATVTASEKVTWPHGMTEIDNRTATYQFTENQKLELWAEDTLGNKGTVVVETTLIDKTAPEIILEETHEAIPLRETFDPLSGVTVEEDNPTKNMLIVKHNLNTGKTGTYTITYTATDQAGNTSTASKEVVVYDPDMFQVVIDGRIPGDSVLIVNRNGMSFETIHPEGDMKIKMLSGKAVMGQFKTAGENVTDSISDGSFTFPGIGYYTLHIQNEERGTYLVTVFAE